MYIKSIILFLVVLGVNSDTPYETVHSGDESVTVIDNDVIETIVGDLMSRTYFRICIENRYDGKSIYEDISGTTSWNGKQGHVETKISEQDPRNLTITWSVPANTTAIYRYRIESTTKRTATTTAQPGGASSLPTMGVTWSVLAIALLEGFRRIRLSG